MEAIKIKAYPDNADQVNAIKAFLKALKIKFELLKEAESPYDPNLVKKIQQGREDVRNGKGVKIPLEDLWK